MKHGHGGGLISTIWCLSICRVNPGNETSFVRMSAAHLQHNTWYFWLASQSTSLVHRARIWSWRMELEWIRLQIKPKKMSRPSVCPKPHRYNGGSWPLHDEFPKCGQWHRPEPQLCATDRLHHVILKYGNQNAPKFLSWQLDYRKKGYCEERLRGKFA